MCPSASALMVQPLFDARKLGWKNDPVLSPPQLIYKGYQATHDISSSHPFFVPQ